MGLELTRGALGSTRLLQTPELAGKDRLRLVRANRGADDRSEQEATRKKAISANSGASNLRASGRATKTRSNLPARRVPRPETLS